MTENSRDFMTDTQLKFTWTILVIAAAILIMGPGIQHIIRGDPIVEWIVDITLGVLLLVFYFGTRLANWMEKDQSASQFGLSSWTTLVLSSVWVIVGIAFISTGFTSIGVLGFTFFGGVGVIGMAYQFWKYKK